MGGVESGQNGRASSRLVVVDELPPLNANVITTEPKQRDAVRSHRPPSESPPVSIYFPADSWTDRSGDQPAPRCQSGCRVFTRRLSAVI